MSEDQKPPSFAIEDLIPGSRLNDDGTVTMPDGSTGTPNIWGPGPPPEQHTQGWSVTIKPGEGGTATDGGQPGGAGGAGPRELSMHELAAAAHTAASAQVEPHGKAAFVVVYDPATGAYQFQCSTRLNVTYAVGFLERISRTLHDHAKG
jgi:hypothetical protein